MRDRLELVVRAALWRRAGSAAVLVAAAVAFAASCLGPLWATSSEDAVGSAAVARAPVAQRSLLLTAGANTGDVDTELIPAFALDAVEQGTQLPPAAERAFGPARTSLQTLDLLDVRGRRGARATVAWQADACERLRLVAGRCPRGRGELLLSRRSAGLLRVPSGGTLEVTSFATEPELAGSGTPFPTRYRVAGLYAPGDPDSAAWAGTSYFAFEPIGSGDVRDRLPPTLDAVFASRELLEALSTAPVAAAASRTLELGPQAAPQRAVVERDLRRWVEQTTGETGTVQVSAPALDLLGGLSRDARTTRRTAVLLGLQLLVLSCWGLSTVVASSVVTRSADSALGGLRGLRRRTTAVLGLGEPLLLVLVGLPLGLLIGAVGTGALAAALLPGNAGLRPDDLLVASVLATAVGAVLAVAVGARAIFTTPVLRQLSGGRGAGAVSGRWSPVAEACVVALAAAAVVQVATDGDGEGGARGLGLLAPALAGIALGVLGARLLRVALGAGVRATRERGGPSTFLAVRGGARRGGTTLLVALLAVSVSVAVYAAGVLAVGAGQRASQAAMETGAAGVYELGPTPVARLLAAVQRVDPDGRRLAAVVRRDGSIAAADRLLAVDAARLGAVAAWRPEWSPTGLPELARALRPPVAPPLLVTGRRLELTVLDAPEPDSGPAQHVVRVRDGDGRVRVLRLGAVEDRASPRVLRTALRGCTRGCRVLSLEVRRTSTSSPRSLIGAVTYQRLVVDGRPVAGAFDDEGGWRPVLPVPRDASPFGVPQLRTTVGARGLLVRYAMLPLEDVQVGRADVPEQLPVLVAGATELRPVGQDGLVFATDLAGEAAPAVVAGRARVLPWLGPEGALADLSHVDRLSPTPDEDAVHEVWSSAPVDRATVRALRAQGLDVVGTRSAVSRTAELEQSGAARVLLLLPTLGLAALAVAGCAMAAQALNAARARAAESAALQAVGVPLTITRRAGLVEGLGTVALAVLAGGVAAVVSLALTADSVLRAGLAAPLAPFPADLPAVALVAAGAAVAAVLAGVAVFCARLGVRSGRADDLRQVAT